MRWYDANEVYWRHAVANTDLGYLRNQYPKILYTDIPPKARTIQYYGVTFSDALSLKFPTISANGGSKGFGGLPNNKRLYTTLESTPDGKSAPANDIAYLIDWLAPGVLATAAAVVATASTFWMPFLWPIAYMVAYIAELAVCFGYLLIYGTAINLALELIKTAGLVIEFRVPRLIGLGQSGKTDTIANAI